MSKGNCSKKKHWMSNLVKMQSNVLITTESIKPPYKVSGSKTLKNYLQILGTKII